MWPVSRREAILRFTQNTAETSSNHHQRPKAKYLSRDSLERPDAALTAPGQSHTTASLQPEGPDMGTVHTQGCGPLFRWRLLVVAATAVNDLTQCARRHVQARREILERHPRIMPGEY